MKKIIKPLAFVLLAALVATQIMPPEKIDGPLDPKIDLSAEPGVPAAVAQALKKGCYDCHSNEPRYPWYTKIGAVNWYITNHIKHGNEHVNFSEWGNYEAKDKIHNMEEICEVIEEGQMPLWNYKLLHAEAVLSEEEKTLICQWVNSNN